MKTWKRIWNGTEDVLSGSLLLIGLAISLYGVFMRYVMNSPQAWVDEIFKYFVIWGVLIGGSVALRENHHISVDILYEAFPKWLRKVVDIFANLVGISFSLFLAYYGYQLVMAKFVSQQLSIDVGVPLWIVYLILPLSGILLGLRFVERIFGVIKGDQEPKEDIHDSALI